MKNVFCALALTLFTTAAVADDSAAFGATLPRDATPLGYGNKPPGTRW